MLEKAFRLVEPLFAATLRAPVSIPFIEILAHVFPGSPSASTLPFKEMVAPISYLPSDLIVKIFELGS